MLNARRSSIVVAVVAVVVVVGGTACTQPVFTSENGTLSIDASKFVDPNVTRVPVMLEGTTLCPPIAGAGGDVTTCFDASADGAAHIVGDPLPDACITLEGEGDATWSFTPTSSPPPSCKPPDGFTPIADSFQFRSIAPEHVHAHVVQPLDELVHSGTGRQLGVVALQPLPGDWAAIDHVAIFAGRPIAPSIALIADSGARVTWRPADAKIDVAGEGVFGFDQKPTLLAKQGSAATIGVTLYGARFETEGIPAVGVDELASMDILHFGVIDRTTGARTTTVLRADIHDRFDRTVLGAPVQWRVKDGDVALRSLASLEGLGNVNDGEWAEITDCRPPPSPALIPGTGVADERSATLEARLDRFVATIPLTWKVPPAANANALKSFQLPDGCEKPADAGGCASTSAASLAPFGVVVVGLLLANTRVRRLGSSRTTVG